MKKDSKNFLYSLFATPSPSGFEQQIQKVVKKRMTPFADEISVDVHGNLMAVFNPEGKIKVMLSGHCDQIGLMITHIDKSGFISVGAIGGMDATVLPGAKVQIHTRDKKVVITTPACDDKTGLFTVMEAFRLVASKYKTKEKKKKFPVALYAVSTVQEELGLCGARTSCFGIDPLVGIAVDVEHATDNPGASAKLIGEVNLGSGPTIARGANVNPIVEELLVKTAKAKKIPYQSIAEPRATGTDANAMQISRAGVAAGLIGLPNRYMHTQVEVVDLRDLEAASKLLAEAVMRITPKMSFIPA